MIFQTKLEKLIRDESLHGDLGTRINRNTERDYMSDRAIEEKPVSYPLLEVWTKSFKIEKEDPDNKLVNYVRGYHGDNIVTFALVPYETTFPNRPIRMPKELEINNRWGKQDQMILDKHALIYRTISFGYADTHIGFGDMISNSRKPTLCLLKNFFKDFAENPHKYSSRAGSISYDVNYPTVLMFPQKELNLDEWWEVNEKRMAGTNRPKKAQSGDVPLIYPDVIVPTLQELGYKKINIKEGT